MSHASESFEYFSESPASQRQPPLVLLVRTRGRDGRLQDQLSGTLAAVRQALPTAIIDSHDVGYLGTVNARRDAVVRLRQRLRHLCTATPNRTLFVAALGHGGNLVLRSIHEESLDGRIRGVICLETPFVYTWQRSFGSLRDDLADALPVLLLTIAFLASLGLFAAGVAGSAWWALPAGAVLVAALATWYAAGSLARSLQRQFARAETAARQHTPLPILRKTPILAFPVPGHDEGARPWTERFATSALNELTRAIAWTAGLTRSVRRRRSSTHAYLLCAAGLATGASLATPGVPAWVWAVALSVPVAFAIAAVVVPLLSSAAFAAAVFASLRRLPSFGPERVRHRLFASVAADSTPFGFPGVTIAPPASSSADRQAFTRRWLNERVAASAPATSRARTRSAAPVAPEFVPPSAWMAPPAAVAAAVAHAG